VGGRKAWPGGVGYLHVMSKRTTRRGWPRKVWGYFRDADVPWWRKAVAALAALYLFTPLDLIPDAIPVLGWLDDLGLVALVAGWLWRDIDRRSRAGGRAAHAIFHAGTARA